MLGNNVKIFRNKLQLMTSSGDEFLVAFSVVLTECDQSKNCVWIVIVHNHGQRVGDLQKLEVQQEVSGWAASPDDLRRRFAGVLGLCARAPTPFPRTCPACCASRLDGRRGGAPLLRRLPGTHQDAWREHRLRFACPSIARSPTCACRLAATSEPLVVVTTQIFNFSVCVNE